MKKIVLLSFAVALSLSLLSLAQDTTKQSGDQMKNDNMKADKKMGKAVSISGKISDDGKTLVSDKDSKTWTISNPDAVKGHEGHEVTVKAHADEAANEIHVVSVKMGKDKMKSTTKKDDMKKDEMK